MPNSTKPPGVVVPEGARWCPGCQRVKPLTPEVFYPDRSEPTGFSDRCRMCKRWSSTVEFMSPERRAKQLAYERSDRRRELHRGWVAKNKEEVYRRKRAATKTVWGRLLSARRNARTRLRRASDPKAAAKTAALIMLYDKEIARIRRNAV